MNIESIIQFLQTPEGSRFFSDLQARSELSINEITELKAAYPDYPINDLLTQIRLQKQAAGRITQADQLLFTEKSVEQSSSSTLAAYHGEKFRQFTSAADLCCGAGIDLNKIAAGKSRVYAVDLDPEILETARYNTARMNLDNIDFMHARAEDFNHSVDAVYLDPDRRPLGKRRIDPDECSPSLQVILDKLGHYHNLLIKLSPMFTYDKYKLSCDHTWEFISEQGTLKEILLNLGKFATPAIRRQAILLPGNHILDENQNDSAEVTNPGKYLFEPDPAVIRAGLVKHLACKLSASLIDARLALLTADQAEFTPFGNWYRVKAEMPFSIKVLQNYLNINRIGELIIKTRGFPETAENFRRKLKLSGENSEVLFLLRTGNKHKMIFTQERN